MAAKIDLTKYGITGTTEIVYNPSYEMLFEEETKETLEGYESKLHLIEKFQTARGMVTKIHALTKEFYKNHDEAVLEEIEQISNQILEEL